MNPLLEAALARAREGACLLPVWWTDGSGTCACPKGSGCSSPGKHPLTPNGLDDASNDPATITRWWPRWPKANIGTALPLETEVIRTPRGGLHIGLATETPVESRTLYLEDGRKLGELKAARAYVVIRPSTIGGRPYQRLSPDGVRPLRVDDPMEWVRKLLSGFGFALAPDRPGTSKDYEALAGVICEGEGRHNALVSYAAKVWVEGMAAETLVDLLRVVTNDEILEHVWGFAPGTGTSEVIRAHVRNLRRKLQLLGAPRDVIWTVPGRGYRLREAFSDASVRGGRRA
jgi:hypothetical protein